MAMETNERSSWPTRRVKVIDGNLLIQAEADLVEQNAELGPDRIGHFARDEAERDAKRMAGAETANDDIDRFGKLFAEAADPSRTRAMPKAA